MSITISDIRFIKVNRKGSHVGFVQFTYDGNIAIKDVAVHQKLDKSSYRLVYPENIMERGIVYPINKETQEHIEEEVNAYIKAQEVL